MEGEREIERNLSPPFRGAKGEREVSMIFIEVFVQ